MNINIKNIKVDESKHSVITKHILKFNHIFDWQNVKIIDFETNYYNRLISEMLYIKTQDKKV